MDEIIFHENQKVSAKKEAYENVKPDFDEREIYQIDNMSIDDKKEKSE